MIFPTIRKQQSGNSISGNNKQETTIRNIISSAGPTIRNLLKYVLLSLWRQAKLRTHFPPSWRNVGSLLKPGNSTAPLMARISTSNFCKMPWLVQTMLKLSAPNSNQMGCGGFSWSTQSNRNQTDPLKLSKSVLAKTRMQKIGFEVSWSKCSMRHGKNTSTACG